jgi:hypothetical protein
MTFSDPGTHVDHFLMSDNHYILAASQFFTIEAWRYYQSIKANLPLMLSSSLEWDKDQ